MEKIKNVAICYDSKNISPSEGILKYYSDGASTGEYDRRIVKIFDSRVATTPDLDKLGDGFIDEHKNIDVKVVMEILDNNESDSFGYDIESIHPGETCSIKGLDQSLADLIEENMLITSVNYTLEKVVLTIEPMRAGKIVSRQQKTEKTIDDIQKGTGMPTDFVV